MLLGPGDACVTTFTLPHSASKNELGPAQPRPVLSLQPYAFKFRVYSKFEKHVKAE